MLLHAVANVVKDFMNLLVDLSVGTRKELQETRIELKHLQERRTDEITWNEQVSGDQCF